MIGLEDMFIRHRNVEASSDLIIPVVLTSPVSVDEMKDNVRVNSEMNVPWLDESTAHDGIALVCGAGPSLGDDIEEIRKMVNDGAKVFASNSAAQYLNKANIPVAYQAVLDPHPVVGKEIGEAENYLFASIIDPDLFTAYPNITLWHPSTAWIDEILPNKGKRFCFIGGGITVSNSSLCLAYTMGFREIHVFGMDSSFRLDAMHVAPLPHIGPGLVITEVESKGRIYRTSFDMKQQVIVFKQLYDLLTAAGCTVKVHGTGLLPDLFINH